MRSFSVFAALSASIAVLGVTGLTLEDRPPIVYVPHEKRGLEKRHYGAFTCVNQQYNAWCQSILQQPGTSTATVGCANTNGVDQCYATCVSGYTRSSDGSMPLCTLNCASGLTLSADRTTCVNTSNDVNNCGTVGKVCADPANGSPTCVNKVCGIACDSGYTASGSSCVASAPTCKDGSTLSNGSCARYGCSTTAQCVSLTKSSTSYCTQSACFTPSSNGGGLPAGSACGPKAGSAGDDNQCASGLICINYTCSSPFASDTNNCGAPGTTCPATGTGVTGAQCVSSSCQVTCGTSYAQSADKKSCVATTSDVNNCGGVGQKCSTTGTGVTGAQCVSSSCQVTCGTGYAQSADKKSCVATTNDPNNCGGVGTVCPSTGTGVTGAQCVNSSCQVTCGNGYAPSTDKKSCVATTNDVNNCGGLGQKCATTGTGVSGAQCVASSCQVTCGSGYSQSADKKSCVSTTNDVNNCGGPGQQCSTTGTGVSGAQCVASSCQVTCAAGYTQSADKKSCTSNCKDGSYYSNGSCIRYTCSSTADCQSKLGTTVTGCYGGVCYQPSSNTAGLSEGSRCGNPATGDDNSCAANLVCFYNTCYNPFKSDEANCGSFGNDCSNNAGAGYVSGSATCTNGVCSVKCGTLYNNVNNVCVLKASAAPRQKKRAEKAITLCPAGETACPIAGSASFGAFSQSQDKAASFGRAAGGYECLDTSSTVESCGGCASIGEGFDCTRIKNSSGVGCSAGQCVVLSCNKGYAVSASGSKCVKIHTGAARRHKGVSSGLIH